MRVAGVVVSARKEGNCLRCMRYCLDRLCDMGFDTLIVNFYDYNVTPCSHCNYECYSEIIRGKREECPIQDDVPKIYEMLENANLILFAVPCYGGHTPALYKTWNERVAHIPGKTDRLKFEDFQKVYLSKIWGFIIIGNLTAAADMTLHEILSDFYNAPPPEAILLQAREYGRSSLKGDLIEEKAVRERLDTFIELLLKRKRQNSFRNIKEKRDRKST